MEKASRILIKIGIIFQLFNAVAFILLTIIAFIISSPASTSYIMEGIKNGTIHYSGPGVTLEEKTYFVQQAFIVVAIIMLVLALIFIASNVFNYIEEKKATFNYLIISFVFSIITINNLFLFLGYLFKLINYKNNEEVISLSDKDI